MSIRLPSIKTLAEIFGDKAKQARAILETKDTREIKSPTVDDVRQNSMRNHKKYYIKMLALSDLGGFHGVEGMASDNDYLSGEFVEYLNAGDCYIPTLIYWRGRYRVQSVGDFVETMERQGIRF